MLGKLLRRVRKVLRPERSPDQDEIEAQRAYKRAEEEARDRRAKVKFWDINRFRRG